MTDSRGNATTSREYRIKSGGESFSVPFTLLGVVYGYCALLTLILSPTIFATSYNHEIKKGTVRTLVCYPVGVLEVSVAKLLYTYIIGFIVCGALFFIVTAGIGKPFGELFLVFLVTLTVTWMTVGIGSFISNLMTYARKKFVLRPHSVPWFLVIFSFIFTTTLISGIVYFFSSMGGGKYDPDPTLQTLSPLITISPYHWGGELLNWLLGGSGFPSFLVLLIPAALIVIGTLVTRRLYPDIYEKE